MYSEKELKTLFKEFQQLPSETEWLEFKEAKNDFDFNKLGKYFSALSNEASLKQKHSGWLILGVKDHSFHAVVGTGYKSTQQELNDLKNDIAQQTNSITFQEIYELNLPEGRVLLLQIPAAPAGIPTSWKGHYYGRDGESLKPLSLHELETIRNKNSGFDWSAEICPQANIKDLDEGALSIARTKFEKKLFNTRLHQESKSWDTETFLNKAGLTRNGKITRTAILLLGKSESAHFLSPHPVQIVWKLASEEKAYEHFTTPFLTSVEEVFKHIRNLKFRIQPSSQLIPIELTKYDSKVILEALNNCIAHQDYSQGARIIVTEQVDRLVFQNIGEFFDGTVEEYVLHEHTPERYRNPFLVKAMVNLDMIDTMGMGIRRMYQEQRKRFFPLPDYELSDQNHVRLTIYGKIIDENYTRLLIDNQDLTLSEVLALDQVQKKRDVPKNVVRELRKKKLIEGRYPNMFISAKVADVTDKRAQYIKNRAFDDSHYEKLILNFIDKYGSATRMEIDELIMDKLPEFMSTTQKRNKIGNILGKMKRSEVIENQGTFKKPKWMRI